MFHSKNNTTTSSIASATTKPPLISSSSSSSTTTGTTATLSIGKTTTTLQLPNSNNNNSNNSVVVVNIGNIISGQLQLTTTQREELQKLNTPQLLIQHFLEQYPKEEDRLQFAKQSTLKLDLFDDFIKRGEKYVNARFALLKLYILDKLQWEIKSKDYFKFLYEYNIAKTFESVRKTIIDDILSNNSGSNRKVIVFIDGDNLSHELSLKELKEHYELYEILLHVVIVFANGVVNDAIMGYETYHWLSIIHSVTNTRDAADTVISLLIGSLHGSLSVLFPTTITHSFIVITKDHFIEEVNKQCILMGRPCFPARNIQDCIILLHKFKSSETIEIFGSSEKALLNSSSTITSSTGSFKSKGVQVTKIVEHPKTENLKELFQVAWLGLGKSQNQFCKMYSLDSTNFSKHMNGKKNNHACRTKLEDFYNTYKKSDRNISRFLLNVEGYLKEIEIKHEINENSIHLTDLSEFSYTTPHHYNPLFKEGYPVLYEEWLNYNNAYRAEFYRMMMTDNSSSSLFQFKCQLNGSIVTIPLRMKHPLHLNDQFVPIDVELRMERGEASVYLRAPIGQLSYTIHAYFSFSHYSPKEYIDSSKRYSSKVKDIRFFDDNLSEADIETCAASTTFKPNGSISKENSNQWFFPSTQIDLGEINGLEELKGRKSIFIKMGNEYVLDTRGSLKDDIGPSYKMILKQSVVDYVTKRDIHPIEVEGIIDSIDLDSNLYMVGCKVL